MAATESHVVGKAQTSSSVVARLLLSGRVAGQVTFVNELAISNKLYRAIRTGQGSENPYAGMVYAGQRNAERTVAANQARRD